jgi:hypothetical protein
MRGVIVSVVMVVAVVAGFIGGLLDSSAGLMLAAFCGMPVAFFALGFALRGAFAGRKLALVSVDQQQRRTMSQQEVESRQSRLQSVTRRAAGE